MRSSEPATPVDDVVRVRIGTTHVMLQLILAFGISVVIVSNALIRWSTGEAEWPVLVFVGLLAAVLLTAAIVEGIRESGRYLEIDANGITYVQRGRRTPLPWRDVIGLGVGFPKATLAMRLSKTLPTRTFYVDVYVLGPDQPDYEAIGGRWRVDTESGYSSMPRARFRFLRFLGSTVDEIRDGVRRHQPNLWLDDR